MGRRVGGGGRGRAAGWFRSYANSDRIEQQFQSYFDQTVSLTPAAAEAAAAARIELPEAPEAAADKAATDAPSAAVDAADAAEVELCCPACEATAAAPREAAKAPEAADEAGGEPWGQMAHAAVLAAIAAAKPHPANTKFYSISLVGNCQTVNLE